MKNALLGSTIVALLATTLVSPGAKAAELLTNGGFEDLAAAAAPGSYGTYAYPEGTIAGWTFFGAGLIDGTMATPWFGGSAPTGFAGAQYGFVQGTGWLVQSFTADATGTLDISWLEGSRPDIFGGGYKGDQTYEVWLSSSLLGTFSTASGQNFVGRGLSALVSGGQSYTLAFHGLSQSDNTAFVDNVSASITPTGGVPEPGTWTMMIAGFGMVGLGMRRRVLTTA
ncbi:PEPxxWA-CTERM sorting domain-containing protein [Sandaracinobacteroides hominis]|uniref:PEPxxWA-CTERM sorting domain-containing protein n=1 Tax=Sandaracinobacteroides hominis TaxID=2780086 RepID=UPI001F411358|nr:PEPxxWA-CTERM sorting domain-containing protein [Sandaracinobacteroides hominis]